MSASEHICVGIQLEDPRPQQPSALAGLLLLVSLGVLTPALLIAKAFTLWTVWNWLLMPVAGHCLPVECIVGLLLIAEIVWSFNRTNGPRSDPSDPTGYSDLRNLWLWHLAYASALGLMLLTAFIASHFAYLLL